MNFDQAWVVLFRKKSDWYWFFYVGLKSDRGDTWQMTIDIIFTFSYHYILVDVCALIQLIDLMVGQWSTETVWWGETWSVWCVGYYGRGNTWSKNERNSLATYFQMMLRIKLNEISLRPEMDLKKKWISKKWILRKMKFNWIQLNSQFIYFFVIYRFWRWLGLQQQL